MKNTGFAVIHAHPELRSDREIALASVSDRGFVLRYLEDSLKARLPREPRACCLLPAVACCCLLPAGAFERGSRGGRQTAAWSWPLWVTMALLCDTRQTGCGRIVRCWPWFIELNNFEEANRSILKVALRAVRTNGSAVQYVGNCLAQES